MKLKKENILAITQGIIKVFDVSPLINRTIQLKTKDDDKKAIKTDFDNVSKDLWRATDDFKEKYC